MSDLVSRVLSAIDEREREHHGVAESLRTAARYKIGVPSVDYVRRAVVEGLRLCQAHRDLVEQSVEVIGDFDLSTYGQFGVLRDHPHSMAVTIAVETLLILARGYGIEEGSDG